MTAPIAGIDPRAAAQLDAAVERARVVVCVGSGGVGKTTTSALLGIHAARQGRRVLVMTIDPARRLANALGLDRMDESVQRIDLDAPGELHATMLDMKKAFDEIVERYAPDEATRRSILENRFYGFFSTSLAGAQELSASERLYDHVRAGTWDLIILDTPPTSNALDFLDAPLRYFDALDSSAFTIVTSAGSVARKGSALLNVGAQFVLKTLGRFTGSEFFEELAEFLTHFSALFEGFRDRTRATGELFGDAGTSFVVVTSPDPLTVYEALYFRQRLRELDVHLGGMVVNRVRRPFDDNALVGDTLDRLADALGGIEGAQRHGRPVLLRVARHLVDNARQFDRLAARDAETIEALRRAVAPAPVVAAPLYAGDVHSLEGLERMRCDLLCEGRQRT